MDGRKVRGVCETVWLVEKGTNSDREVVGVWATREAAIAANPVPADYLFPAAPSLADESEPGGWRPLDPAKPDGTWVNGLDWSHAGTCEPFEVATA